MLLTLATIYIAKAALIQTASVSISNYFIRQTTTVSLSLTLPSTLPTNGSLQIQFPQQLQIPSQVLCSLDQGVTSPSSAKCISNNESILISNCFPTTSNIILSLYGIVTPNYALTTESFSVYSFNENGLVIDSVEDGLTLEFFPVLMNSAKIVVSKEQMWTLSIDTKFEVPQLVLQLPTRDGYLDPPAGYSSLYCRSLICSNVSNFVLSSPCACVNEQVLFFGSSPGGNSILEFRILAPPSNDTLTGFSVYSLNSKGKIEYFDVNVTSEYQGMMNLSFETTNQELGMNSSYLLLMSCENSVPVNGKLFMQFSQFGVEQIQVFGIFGIDFVTNFEVLGQDLNVLSSFSGFLKSGTEIMVLLDGVKNPDSVNEGKIAVQILTQTDGVLCGGEVEIEIQPHSIKVELSVTELGINQESAYVFTIFSEYFSEADFVQIVFPEEINTKSSDCSVSGCLIANNTLNFSNLPNNSQELTIVVSGVINPSTTKSTDSFVVSLYTTAFVQVCKNNSIYLTPTPGKILATLNIRSAVVGALSNYTFEVLLTNEVPNDGVFLVLFPDSIDITPTSTCDALINMPSSASCKFSLNTLSITNLFSDGFHQNFKFSITELKNPPNSCPTSSFTLKTLINSYAIDEISTGLQVSANILGVLSINSSLSSPTVGEIAFLSISLQSTNPLPAILLLTFPPSFILSSAFCTKSSTNLFSATCSLISSPILNVNLTFVSENQFTAEFQIENIQNPPNLTPTLQLQVQTLNNSCTIDQGFTQLSITTPAKLQVFLQFSNLSTSTLSNYTFTINYTNPVPLSGYLLISLPSQIAVTLNTSCIPSCQIHNSQITTLPASTIQILNLANSEDSSTPLSITLSTFTNSFMIDSYTTPVFYSTCLSNCVECQNSPVLCTLCPAGTFLYNSQCLTECPSGFGLINSTCSKCRPACESCVLNEFFCTECLEGFAYNGNCTETCPVNTTVQLNKTCFDCLETCETCSESPDLCTGCYSGQILYFNQCLQSCPPGYMNVSGQCLQCPCSEELLNNSQCDPECDVEACNFDNLQCASYLSVKALPSVTTAAGSAVVTAGNKVLGKGEMIGPTVALWSVTQTCSWVSFSYKLSAEPKGRRLEAGLGTKKVFYLFLGIILLNILMNFVFTAVYFGKYARGDRVHYEWMMKHKVFVWIVAFFAAVFSFQLIRMTYSGPLCLNCCKSPFFRMSTITIILTVYTVLYFVVVLAPAISLFVYVLFSYDPTDEIYTAAIDCLVLTIMIALTTLFDLVKLSIQIGLEKERPSATAVVPNNEGKRPQDTDEVYEEQINTERKLKETGMTELFDPDDPYGERLAVGYVLNGSERLELEDFDKIDGLLWAKDQSFKYLVKYSGVEFDGFEGCKIIDSCFSGQWTIGRPVNEDELTDIKVYKNEKDKVSAVHLKTGHKVIALKSFVGGYLNDFATGTALYRTLNKEEEALLVLDYKDPSYASLEVEGCLLRVFRTFDNSVVIDILHEEQVNYEVSFSQDSKGFYEKAKEESKHEEVKNKEEEEENESILGFTEEKPKIVEKTVSGDTRITD